MKTKIRKAKMSDLKKIVEMETKQNLLHEVFNPPIYAADNDFERKWTRLLKKEWGDAKHHLLVAVDGKTIVGFIYGKIKDRPLRKIKKYGLVDEIFIEKNYRGKGIGTRLMGNLINWLKTKGIAHVEAVVSSKNKESIKFHKKLGFEEYEKTIKKDI